LVDTSYRIEQDIHLAIVTDKDADGLDLIRHSTAHLLAFAVKELFPDAQVTIGPVIEDGFYYDFSYKRPFTLEDLAAIEKRMGELAKKDIPVTREEWDRDQAVEFFKSIGEHYKAEIIASIPAGQTISLYREGDFIDLCRGPHVPSTGKIKVFKLMKLAGAYWRGDSKNEMLQRVYGTAWAQQGRSGRLSASSGRSREARSPPSGQAARSVPFAGRVARHGVLASAWLDLWQEVEQYMRRKFIEYGYQEVKTPTVMDKSLWEKSGHWDNYRDNMFTTHRKTAITR
jgi:threonyl-tRNA synthetase